MHVSDSSWHSLVVHRRKRHAWLQVDDEIPIRGIADQGATLLNTNARLWIGEQLYQFLQIHYKLTEVSIK